MVGGDDDVGSIEGVAETFGEFEDFLDGFVAGFKDLAFAGSFVADRVDYIVVNVDDAVGFDGFAALIDRPGEQVSGLEGDRGDIAVGLEGRVAGDESLGAFVVAEDVGGTGEEVDRATGEEGGHTEAGNAGKGRELGREGGVSAQFFDEFGLDFSGDFVAEGVGNDDEDFLSIVAIDNGLDLGLEEVGLGGDVGNFPGGGVAEGIGPIFAEVWEEAIGVKAFDVFDQSFFAQDGFGPIAGDDEVAIGGIEFVEMAGIGFKHLRGGYGFVELILLLEFGEVDSGFEGFVGAEVVGGPEEGAATIEPGAPLVEFGADLEQGLDAATDEELVDRLEGAGFEEEVSGERFEGLEEVEFFGEVLSDGFEGG